jgi:hypothetical protein
MGCATEFNKTKDIAVGTVMPEPHPGRVLGTPIEGASLRRHTGSPGVS